MSFFRHGEIYRSDVGHQERSWYRPLPASAATSFQAGIPWPVALQQSQPPLPRPETILSLVRAALQEFLISERSG